MCFAAEDLTLELALNALVRSVQEAGAPAELICSRPECVQVNRVWTAWTPAPMRRVEQHARRRRCQDLSWAKARPPSARKEGVIPVEVLVVLGLFEAVVVRGAHRGTGVTVVEIRECKYVPGQTGARRTTVVCRPGGRLPGRACSALRATGCSRARPRQCGRWG